MQSQTAHLMREYVEALEADISFQDFESECADLPGKYARPEGVVLIAWTADEAVGIVAYRPLERRICEMKRPLCLAQFSRYGSWSPSCRGAGSRRQITRLSENGPRHLASMRPAEADYGAMGFRPIPAYYDNPLPGVIYMALDL